MVFILLVALGISGCSTSLSLPDAKTIARKRLEQYCASEKIDVASFVPTGTPHLEGATWAFDYASSNSMQNVRIYVRQNETTEIHRMLEE